MDLSNVTVSSVGLYQEVGPKDFCEQNWHLALVDYTYAATITIAKLGERKCVPSWAARWRQWLVVDSPTAFKLA